MRTLGTFMITALLLLPVVQGFAAVETAGQGNCDSIDKAPERMRAKLEKMCAGSKERRKKEEQTAQAKAAWSKAYFDGGRKRRAVYTVYKNHQYFLYPCEDYATNCAVEDLPFMEGVGSEIYKEDGNVVFMYKEAIRGNAFVTCYTYVTDPSGEKMISRDSKVCGTN